MKMRIITIISNMKNNHAVTLSEAIQQKEN